LNASGSRTYPQLDMAELREMLGIPLVDKSAAEYISIYSPIRISTYMELHISA
jgi:hypothetical protein